MVWGPTHPGYNTHVWTGFLSYISYYTIRIMLIFKRLCVFSYYTTFKYCYLFNLISNRPVCPMRLNHIEFKNVTSQNHAN